jgi:class 3 adenylate cyclase
MLGFLLADIDDSTMLWELHTEAMRSAVADHDRIVMAAAESAGGRLVKRVGTASISHLPTFAPQSPPPVRSSVGSPPRTGAKQGPLRVRMAVDVGEVEARGGDYFGPVLNRAGRLVAAHGGQVLLSADAHAALAATHDGWQAKALGEFRFKGIGSPQNVFQLPGRRAPRRLPAASRRPAFSVSRAPLFRPLGSRLRAARAGRRR